MQEVYGIQTLTRFLWENFTFLQVMSQDLLAFLLLVVAGTAVLVFVLVLGIIAVWAERKVAGHVQDRLGPMRAGWHGWLQTVADGIKLMLKEAVIHKGADKPLFILAPFLAFLSALAGYLVLPFSMRAQMADLDIGVLYISAVTSLGVVAIIMAGWASNAKWPLYGAMRSAALVVSYGVPLTLSIIPVLMVAGSLSMQEIVMSQSGSILDWNFFRAWPFMPAAFLVFFIAALAETNRVPFDIAEAESELVGGYHTEYSGIMWSVFFMGEYAAMFLSCGMATTLFLGGYLGPRFGSLGCWGIPRFLAWLAVVIFLYWRFRTHWDRRQLGEAIFFALFTLFGLAVWAIWPHLFWFLIKSSALFILMLILRWTLPRLRIDQMMHMCWKVLIPVAFVNLLGTGIWFMWVH
ncbi:MAG: NADH-quinone oxidoreductase subunit H [Candidatus Riflebacteria bacterium]|nr:NADH-quinone oxidoreductase subunit H [Candidatus Riflebacteria bacterium]